MFQDSGTRPEGTVNVVSSGAPSPSSQAPIIITQTSTTFTQNAFVTVSLPPNKVFTTTNSSGAYTYSFNSTAPAEYDQQIQMVTYRDQNGFVPSTFCNFEHEDGMLDTSTGDSSLSSWLESRAFGSQGWPQKSSGPLDEGMPNTHLTWEHRNTYPAGTTTVTCSFTDLEPSDYITDLSLIHI